MPVYPKEIAELIRESKCGGSLIDCNAFGSEAKFDCGCFIRFEMLIADSPSRIEEIRYSTNGCGFMVAAAESLSVRLRSLPLSEVQAHIDIGAVFFDRKECSDAVVKAARVAFADYRTRTLEEFSGEKPLICMCFGVAEETVEEFARTSHSTTVEDVSDGLRAGSGCGSCRMLIQEIIDANA